MRFRRMTRIALCLLVVLNLAFPLTARAQEADRKKVRVGWYESSYNSTDASGRRSGYAYEYQLKLAAYTGWTYEYVNGSWSDLLQMLAEGKIDLMSDVSYTPERGQHMLYPSLPMGTEEYYLLKAPGNSKIDPSDPSTLNGKRVGANKDSVQYTFYEEWAARNGIQSELVATTGTENDSLQMLGNGTLDAYVTVDSFQHPESAAPVFKVGSSDFFFAVSKNRPDLLTELNSAMDRIQNENRYYNQQMYEKYIKRNGANVFLTSDELEWLASHGTIRVGYLDNHLAFCAADEETGELTGLLKDYLTYASRRIENADPEFSATAYPTTAAALKALEAGEVDCVFPAIFQDCDAESMGFFLTPALMDTELYTVVRQTDQSFFSRKEHVIVAVTEDDPNYESILLYQYPDWRKVYYPSTEECLKSVSEGVADCVLLSNFRYNNIARLCDRLRLSAFTTGVELDYRMAVKGGETEMYSILSKAIALVPPSAVNATLSNYIAEDAKLTFLNFIEDNLGASLAVTGAVVLVILVLMIQNMRAARRARKLISATENDDLTGLYNRSFFFHYCNRMFRSHPDTPMDAIVLNIDQFHSVNALHGREFGDHALRVLGNEIRTVTKEIGGIAGRIEADRFDVYCNHIADYRALFDRLQSRMDSLAATASVRLRMGVMPWEKDLDPVQLFDRARTACTMARGHYKEHLVIFNEKIREQELYEQRLQNDLRGALDSFQFEVYYQPKFDIQSDPPKLSSAEALVRWRHPELGMIPPSDFIPLFERSGQIGILDQYVWSEAARQIVRWREKYGVTIPVSVNLSRVDVFDHSLEKTLDDILALNGLDQHALRLEVTESAYTENAGHLIQVVESLRKKGYEVEMDDFGTGYSSLNMLSAMPIDVLKMDREFIRNIEHDQKDIQLVALILDIARNLNIPVVAEGVETEEQMKLLKNLGCALVQGYYFSRPLQPGDFEASFIRPKKPA